MAPKRLETTSKMFDALFAIISIFDFTTDIIILINWWYNDRLIFFGIGISFILLAHFSYYCAFLLIHAGSGDSWNIAAYSCSIIPLTPFLGIIWPLVASPDSSLQKLFCCKIAWNHDGAWIAPYTDTDRVTTWRRNLFYRNTTHVLHAIIQSFPQCILQIVAIYYFKESNNVSLSISITTSIIMICSQFYVILFIFEIRRIVNLIYIISCFAVDFVGITFIISILFYYPSNGESEMSSYFGMIRYIYLWEGIVCIGSLIAYTYVVLSITLMVIGCVQILSLIAHHENLYCNNNCMAGLCMILGILIVVPFMCFGMIFFWIVLAFIMALLGIALSIIGVSWTLFVVDSIIIEKRINYEANKFYYDNLDWIVGKTNSIKDGDGNITLSKKQNKIVKLCVINQVLLKNHPLASMNYYNRDVSVSKQRWKNYYDTGLIEYLDNHQRQNFKNVSLKEMRQNCVVDENWMRRYTKHVNPFKHFGNQYYFDILNEIISRYKNDDGLEKCVHGLAIAVVGFVNYILGPVYFTSKIFNLLMPFIIVGYMEIDGHINYFVAVDIYLVIIWCLYVVVILIWMISSCYMLNEAYYAWHILPSTKLLYAAPSSSAGASCEEVQQQIEEYYFRVALFSLIEETFINRYGSDVTNLIIDYLDSIECTSKECLIETLLDNLFGITITDIILGYHCDRIERLKEKNIAAGIDPQLIEIITEYT